METKEKLKVFNEFNIPQTIHSSLQGHIKASYSELVEVLGEPTLNEPSGDNKTQIEWVLEFNGDLFTIYDWKTYDREYTINELSRFNIGGYSSPFELIDYLENKIKQQHYETT